MEALKPALVLQLTELPQPQEEHPSPAQSVIEILTNGQTNISITCEQTSEDEVQMRVQLVFNVRGWIEPAEFDPSQGPRYEHDREGNTLFYLPFDDVGNKSVERMTMLNMIPVMEDGAEDNPTKLLLSLFDEGGKRRWGNL